MCACCGRGQGALPPVATRLPPTYFHSKEDNLNDLFSKIYASEGAVQADMPMTADEEAAAMPAAPDDKRFGGAFFAPMVSFE